MVKYETRKRKRKKIGRAFAFKRITKALGSLQVIAAPPTDKQTNDDNNVGVQTREIDEQ